ncbi:hypothetical protein [Ruminococcus sp.]|uniref:hypothetical protein n=1 Tax=Ruminococcus sp. TaxID=41978 RepID=UPI0025FB4F2A|nr:hypothetical protein [Ruminococcus sp.]MBR1431842.1 hypothetical protein [Ruminococcus sp.]
MEGKTIQTSFKQFFKRDSFLMWSILIGSILWLTNAVFNFAAKDYRAFCINVLYVICLLTLGGATFKQEKDIVQGMIGALMMVSVIGNDNVLSEMLDTTVPSRALWQMIVGAVLTVGLFINHFMITRKKTRKLWRIEINQCIVLLLLLFRTYQVIENIVSRGFTTLMAEITVGLLAIVPTLNVIACIESRTDTYIPEY